MAVTFAVGVRACCVAVGLLLAVTHAAEPVSPLVGATREQLLSRYGEPRSQIESGNLVVMFYPRERVVLRNNVVVEVEQLGGEAPPAEASASNLPAAPVGETLDETANPTSPAPPPPSPLPGPDAKLEIKRVRPPSAKGSGPEIPEPSQPVLEPKVSSPVSVVPTIEPAETSTAEADRAPSEQNRAERQAGKTAASAEAAPDARDQSVAAETVDNEARETSSPPPTAPLAAPSPANSVATPGPTPAPEPEVGVLSNRTYLIVAIVLVGGLAFLFWRRRQLQAELAASSVENTPLPTSSPTGGTAKPFGGSRFTEEMLHDLEWERFEELVAAYYSKTGVVAVRTKTGPGSRVHIKISWKGEPQPFAYVHCICSPPGLIDAKPLQALVDSLTADGIRRGYVVTTGRFNVTARDYGEEKHLTLLPGDVFLEKLNALPTAARGEIMKLMGNGDQAPPLCPRCSAKMIVAPDLPGLWQCPNHPDETIPVRN